MNQALVQACIPAQRRSPRKGLVARWLRLATAALLIGFGAAASAQYAFEAYTDIEPSSVPAGEYATVTVTLDAGSVQPNKIAFTGTLPAGISVLTPVNANQCGGTLSTTATTYVFANGSIPGDSTCEVRFYVTATPAVLTDYTLKTGNVDYYYGPPGDESSGIAQGGSAVLTVQGGVPPEFTDSLPYDGNVGIPYYYYIYFNQGTEPITVTVTGLPPGLSFDPDERRIIGTPTTVGTYMTTIKASNAFGGPIDATYAIRIDAAPMSASKSFSPSTITTGGTSMMTIVLTYTGYYADSVGFTDNFPAGMSATPTTFGACDEGTVTVTANSVRLTGGYLDAYESGSASCTIQVEVKGVASSTRDLVNNTGPITYYYSESPRYSAAGASGTLRVLADAPVITSGLPLNGVVGGNYMHQVTVSGTPTISVSATGLPPGLTFNPTTRTVTGVPTKAGSYQGSFIATNGIAPDARQNFTLVIKAPPLVITTVTLPPISDGGDVNAPIAAAGGIPPYTFNILSGALPPGLKFTPAGFLTGTPTLPGTYPFVVQVTDSINTKATKAYSIVIDKSTPAFAFQVMPVPAVPGQPVVVSATLIGGAGDASGPVQVWVAHSYERCPTVPGDAPPAAKSATASLDAGGAVQFTFTDLTIDNYTICGSYAGDVRYKSATAGPIDLFIIKGVLLPTPVVALSAPLVARISSAVATTVKVLPAGATARTPQGSVILRANGIAVATVPLVNGLATFSTTAPARPGPMVLTASYYGDVGYSPASSSATVVAVKAEVSDPQPVPTLSELALALLLGALGLSGARAAARQRRH